MPNVPEFLGFIRGMNATAFTELTPEDLERDPELRKSPLTLLGLMRPIFARHEAEKNRVVALPVDGSDKIKLIRISFRFSDPPTDQQIEKIREVFSGLNMAIEIENPGRGGFRSLDKTVPLTVIIRNENITPRIRDIAEAINKVEREFGYTPPDISSQMSR
jgi:hypothetical protein